MLLYGIFAAIVLSFSIKKIFNTILYAQYKNKKILNHAESVNYIRLQNFNTQQHCSTGTRIWIKKKKSNFDF